MSVVDTPQERPIGFGRLKRKEDARFIRGKGTYLDDIRLPGMLHGAILRSPFAHARINSIDTSEALAHPNVAAVITAKDLETLGLAWMPTISYDTQAVLAGDKVRFQGQEVAFVIATDEYSARDALQLIDVDYDPLPAVVNARKALDPDAPLIRDDKDGQRDNLASPTWEAGDEEATDRAFAEADTVVARDMIYPRCHPAPLETCGIIADFNPETGQLDIYNGNQAPHAHRTVYAHVAGLAEHMIRIRCNDIGGGFGNKVPVYPGYVCAIAGSIVAGVPIKWIEDRSENLMSTGFARDYVMKAEMCAKDGRITGLRVDVIADHGAFDSTAQPTKFPAGFFHICCGSYDLQASHVKVKAVYTNKAPGGVAYRCSFRITEAVYLVERMVDALALELKADPIDLRMRSFIRPEQFPYETTTGWTYDSGNYAETMKVAMDIAGYDDLRREQAEKRARGELMGIGVSFFTEGVGAGPRKHMDILGLSMNDGADLRVHPSGKAVVSLSAQTQGQGHETTFAQIVAEELGIPPEDVEVRHGDTDKSPYGLGTYGSRSTPVSGAAVAVVSRKVRDKARLIAATMLETRPEDLAWEKGRWYVKGDPEQGALIEDIAARAYSGERAARGHGGRARRAGDLRPAEPDLPLRRLHRRGRHRRRDGRGPGAAVHRGRRLRRPDQPDDRRRPDPRRARRGHRHRADGGDHVRRRRQLPQQLVHGLPDPDGARVPRLRAGRDRHAVPAPPARREGRRRVAQRGVAAGDRQRGDRRAARDARRRPHRHAVQPGAGLGGDAGARRAAAVSPRDVTGEAAGELRHLAPDVETLAQRLAEVDYLVDEGLATAMFLGLRLPQPLLLEGEAGVGKTEAGKALAAVLDTPLIRLQCYDGIDATEALYEWNYPRQLLSIRLADANRTALSEDDLFGPDYLIRRPLLRALEHPGPRPAVLLIDEIDRADDDFEAFLLELLGEAAVTIPELGTVRATHPPVIVLTSNRTRDLHDAVKRRCLYQWIDYPTPGARGRDRAPPGQGDLRVARRPGRARGGADARQRRAEAAGDRRGDRLARRARAARRGAARRGRGRPHARLGAEVRRGPGRRPRGRARPAGRERRVSIEVETIALDLPALVARFGRRLHEAGVPVTPERSARFAQALVLVRPVSRRRLYCTARAVLVSDPAQFAAFDAVFAAVFGSIVALPEPPPEDARRVAVPPDDRPAADRRDGGGGRGAAGGAPRRSAPRSESGAARRRGAGGGERRGAAARQALRRARAGRAGRALRGS